VVGVSSQAAPQKRAGERVEGAVIDRVTGLGNVPDAVAQHYDAVAVDFVTPAHDLPFVGVCLLERGTRVEIKSTIARLASGARGRFYFRPRQHDALLAVDGVYALAVCEPKPTRRILALKIVPAVVLDDALPNWFAGGDGRSDYAQLAWSNIFAPTEVAR